MTEVVMNLREILGYTKNKQLLADIAVKYLPMAEAQCSQMQGGIKGAKAGINRAIQVQTDCKYILRHQNKFTPSVVRWAAVQKAEANFDEHRYRGEKENFLEGYREGRALTFLLKSVIKMAVEEEAENVSNNTPA